MSLNIYHLGSYCLLCILFSSSCQSEQAVAEQLSYTGSFNVRYLAESSELRGQATIYAPDSTTVLLEKGLAFMSSGTQLKQLPRQVNRYDGKQRIPYTSPLRFDFTLPEQTTITQVSLAMLGISDFSITSASKADGLRLDIDGNIKADESLLLLLTDSNQELRTIVRPGPLSTESLFIPADAIALFTPGDYRLYLVKSKKITGKTDDGFEYNFAIEFYTREKNFTLAE